MQCENREINVCAVVETSEPCSSIKIPEQVNINEKRLVNIYTELCPPARNTLEILLDLKILIKESLVDKIKKLSMDLIV